MKTKPKKLPKSQRPKPVAWIECMGWPHPLFLVAQDYCHFCSGETALSFDRKSKDLPALNIRFCQINHRKIEQRTHYYPRDIEGEALIFLLAEKYPGQTVSLDKLREELS